MTGFVCQSNLKERRTPTGGVRLEESLGGRVFMPSSPGVGQKTLEPRLLDFPLPGENDGYC